MAPSIQRPIAIRGSAQMLSLLFALHASVTQLAPLHRRTKAAGLYALAMTVV
jgi:hypothetical protein